MLGRFVKNEIKNRLKIFLKLKMVEIVRITKLRSDYFFLKEKAYLLILLKIRMSVLRINSTNEGSNQNIESKLKIQFHKSIVELTIILVVNFNQLVIFPSNPSNF